MFDNWRISETRMFENLGFFVVQVFVFDIRQKSKSQKFENFGFL